MEFSGKSTGVGCHLLLQGIFLTQGSNLCLLIGRRILYCWATREAQERILEWVVLNRYCPELWVSNSLEDLEIFKFSWWGNVLSLFSHVQLSDSLQPQGLYPPRLLCPWDSLARIPEWVTISSARRFFLFQGTHLQCLLHCRWILSYWATWDAVDWGWMLPNVGCSLLYLWESLVLLAWWKSVCNHVGILETPRSLVVSLVCYLNKNISGWNHMKWTLVVSICVLFISSRLKFLRINFFKQHCYPKHSSCHLHILSVFRVDLAIVIG